MSIVDLKQNFALILKALEVDGKKPTSIAKSMGYTTTAQLHSVLDGDSLISTKAIVNLIENLNVNPSFLFCGKGSMFLTDENEIDELRKKVQELTHNHSEAVKTVFALNDMIQKLEKRNADLIDLTSAAIKYHKGLKQDEPDNIIEIENADKIPEILKRIQKDAEKILKPEEEGEIKRILKRIMK